MDSFHLASVLLEALDDDPAVAVVQRSPGQVAAFGLLQAGPFNRRVRDPWCPWGSPRRVKCACTRRLGLPSACCGAKTGRVA
jgi:hypothetical protein